MGHVRLSWDKIGLGVPAGIIGPWIGFVFYYLSFFSHLPLSGFVELVKVQTAIQSPLLSLCLLANLAILFVGLRWNAYFFCRGVLMSTFLYVPVAVYLKYFS